MRFFGFLTKGDIIPDQEVIATPETTRPIGKKNTFNKGIGGTWGNAIKRAVAANLHHAQRGMTPGRNFVNNIVDLDCMGRIFGFLGHATSFLPLLVFFDIAAAYPSLCHAFMFLVFEAIGFLMGWSTFLDACIIMSRLMVGSEAVLFLCSISCPGSSKVARFLVEQHFQIAGEHHRGELLQRLEHPGVEPA